ncbi:MAG: LysO family transporter [Bacillota bacterium]|nr:LysO family transporter [Bacillota bacterium]
MWSIAVTVTLGIIVGVLIKWTDDLKKINSKFQILGLTILLFFMGVSIGSNPEIINDLSLIGLKAITFSLLTIMFSALTIFAVTYMLRRKLS